LEIYHSFSPFFLLFPSFSKIHANRHKKFAVITGACIQQFSIMLQFHIKALFSFPFLLLLLSALPLGSHARHRAPSENSDHRDNFNLYGYQSGYNVFFGADGISTMLTSYRNTHFYRRHFPRAEHVEDLTGLFRRYPDRLSFQHQPGSEGKKTKLVYLAFYNTIVSRKYKLIPLEALKPHWAVIVGDRELQGELG
jgi:hypothetical protein